MDALRLQPIDGCLMVSRLSLGTRVAWSTTTAAAATSTARSLRSAHRASHTAGQLQAEPLESFAFHRVQSATSSWITSQLVQTETGRRT